MNRRARLLIGIYATKEKAEAARRESSFPQDKLEIDQVFCFESNREMWELRLIYDKHVRPVLSSGRLSK